MHPQRSTTYTPTYTYQFHTQVKEMLLLNFNYDQKIIQFEKSYKVEQKRLESVRLRLNSRSAAGEIIGSIEWRSLDRDMETQQVELTKRKNVQVELHGRINILAEMLLGHFREIADDHMGSYINDQQFMEYLKSFQEIIRTGCDLPCYNTPGWQEISKQILKYLHHESN